MAARVSRIAQFHKESWVTKFKQIDCFFFLVLRTFSAKSCSGTYLHVGLSCWVWWNISQHFCKLLNKGNSVQYSWERTLYFMYSTYIDIKLMWYFGCAMSLYVYCVVKSLVVCFLNALVCRSRGFYITCENEYGSLNTKQNIPQLWTILKYLQHFQHQSALQLGF